MALSPAQRTRLTRCINRLVRANEADAFKGAGHPDDYDSIEDELKSAKRGLKAALDDVTLLPTDNAETRRRKLGAATE